SKIEWHQEKPKVLCHLVPSLKTRNLFPQALPLAEFTGGGASQNRFPASRLGTIQSKGCVLT
ncbi:MAG: hypothetical protein ACYTXE_39540, partial [Nostoc sp.]